MLAVLSCASTTSHLRNFHLPYLRWFSLRDCRVSTLTDKKEPLPFVHEAHAACFTKRFWSPKNIRALAGIRRLLDEKRFDLIITNTPLAGAVVRAAILLSPGKDRPVVCHICHGYLFGGRDRLRKWLYLLPEKICARVTDTLVVMNREDEAIARRYRLFRGTLAFVNGLGVDTARFRRRDGAFRAAGREKYGIARDAFVFLYAAEFSKRKNHALLIKAFEKAFPRNGKVLLLLCGDGVLLNTCRARVENLRLGDTIRFLGQAADMAEIVPLCDAAVSASRYEGLPFNLMEAMACGLPILASDIKGHRDLLAGTDGTLFRDRAELICGLGELYAAGKRTARYANLGNYALPAAQAALEKVYENCLGVRRTAPAR